MNPRRGADKPETKEDFIAWAIEQGLFAGDDLTQGSYEATISRFRQQVTESDAWGSLPETLRRIANLYDQSNKSPLFHSYPDELQEKEYNSVLTKMFRLGAVWHRGWPREPRDGWVTPYSWWVRMDDLLRTRCFVMYLDGVTFLLAELETYFASHSLKFKVRYPAKMTGYYAAHAYVKFPVVDTLRGDRLEIDVEIQISTQLQQVIQRLTAVDYAETRQEADTREDKPWQWRYTEPKFTIYYFGHVLHFLEARIVEARNNMGKELSADVDQR